VFPPRSLLAHYFPALEGLRWQRVAGGFSGAEVWRADSSLGVPAFALKGWPAEFPASRLTEIHAWLARAAHLPFAPTVLPTVDRNTLVTEGGRIWDVTRWMPGESRESPRLAEIEAACAAVARLHAVWRDSITREPAPGVLNRLRVLREWVSARPTPALNPLLARAAEVVAAAAPVLVRALQAWEAVNVAVQPCVRDLRGDHVLFRAGEVTGMVDYGGMALDYPGIDLARLLGDFADDETSFRAGLNAYRDTGGELDEPDAFIRELERAGVVCSLIGWLKRLAAGGQTAQDSVPQFARVRHLLARWEQGSRF
jgi:hypothetical protein